MTSHDASSVLRQTEKRSDRQKSFDFAYVQRQYRRLTWALAIIGGLLLAVSVSGFVLQEHTPGVAREAVQAVTQETFGSVSLVDALNAPPSYKSVAPDGFEAEVMSLSGYRDIRVSEEGSIVGFSSNHSCTETFNEVSETLVHNGWTKIESGQDSSGTFVKNQGMYRWIYLVCTEVSGQTSAVMQWAEGS